MFLFDPNHRQSHHSYRQVQVMQECLPDDILPELLRSASDCHGKLQRLVEQLELLSDAEICQMLINEAAADSARNVEESTLTKLRRCPAGPLLHRLMRPFDGYSVRSDSAGAPAKGATEKRLECRNGWEFLTAVRWHRALREQSEGGFDSNFAQWIFLPTIEALALTCHHAWIKDTIFWEHEAFPTYLDCMLAWMDFEHHVCKGAEIVSAVFSELTEKPSLGFADRVQANWLAGAFGGIRSGVHDEIASALSENSGALPEAGDLRVLAIELIGWSGNQTHAQTLVPLLSHNSRKIRDASAWALMRCNVEAMRAAYQLGEDLLDQTSSQSEAHEFRKMPPRSACEYLHNLLDCNERSYRVALGLDAAISADCVRILRAGCETYNARNRYIPQ